LRLNTKDKVLPGESKGDSIMLADPSTQRAMHDEINHRSCLRSFGHL